MKRWIPFSLLAFSLLALGAVIGCSQNRTFEPDKRIVYKSFDKPPPPPP